MYVFRYIYIYLYTYVIFTNRVGMLYQRGDIAECFRSDKARTASFLTFSVKQTF